jgi:hypothetical protein
MDKLNKQHVQNALDSFKKENPELQDFTLQWADKRLGKKVALVNKLGHIQTDFMTLTEMNQFLRGYYFKSTNKFVK